MASAPPIHLRTSDPVFELSVLSMNLPALQTNPGFCENFIETLRLLDQKIHRFEEKDRPVFGSKGIMLGKGDIALFSHAEHELWLCRRRASLHATEGIRSIVALPSQRLHHRKVPIPPEKRLFQEGAQVVGFSAIRPRYDNHRTGSRQPHVSFEQIHRATQEIFNIGDSLGRDLKAQGLSISPSIDVFLTLNDYRGLIKFEAASFLQAERILSELRRQARHVEVTSTQFCLPFEDPDELLTWDRTERNESTDFPMALRISATTQLAPRVISAVCDIISSTGHLEDKSVFSRHGYWDYVLIFTVSSLHRVIHALICQVLELEGITGSRVVPYVNVPKIGGRYVE